MRDGKQPMLVPSPVFRRMILLMCDGTIIRVAEYIYNWSTDPSNRAEVFGPP